MSPISNLLEQLNKLLVELRSGKVHDYSSGNADRYKGFDAGQSRAAESLETVLKNCGFKVW